MGNKVKGIIAAVGTLAAATIGVLTIFQAVRWSAAQTTLVTTESAAVFAFLTALIAHLWKNTQQEPVALAGAFTALCSATAALGVGFQWWHWSSEQTSALVAVISAAIGVGGALIARQQVTAHPKDLEL